MKESDWLDPKFFDQEARDMVDAIAKRGNDYRIKYHSDSKRLVIEEVKRKLVYKKFIT